MKNLDIADIVANLIVIADNLDETHQIESDTIRSMATQLESFRLQLMNNKMNVGEELIKRTKDLNSNVESIMGNSANLIECFSYVHGHKEAQEVVIDLNGMKSIGSDPFYIEYNKTQDYSKNDSYLVKGNVTRKDWVMLNLNMDFMKDD